MGGAGVGEMGGRGHIALCVRIKSSGAKKNRIKRNPMPNSQLIII